MSRCSRLVDSDATETDAAVERHFARLRGELLPDPLFRRRLRSHAINHFVASRERHEVRAQSSGRQSRMGSLGRASLIASVALAMSAAAVLGVSQEALPGDPLYGVKLRVEELRFTVAPAELQPMLLAVVVGERLEEMSRLVDAGRLDDAVAMGPVVKREIERLAESGQEGAGVAVAHQLQVLDELINRLPPQARAGITRSWDELTSKPVDGEPPATTNPGGAGSGANAQGHGGGPGSGGNGSGQGGGPGSGGNSSAGGGGGGGGGPAAIPGVDRSSGTDGAGDGGPNGEGNETNQGGAKNPRGRSGGDPAQGLSPDTVQPTPKGDPSSD